MTAEEQQAEIQKTAMAFSAAHPELNVDADSNAYNSNVIETIRQAHGMAFDGPGLEAAYAVARVQGLLRFRETIDAEVYAVNHMPTKDLKRLLEMQQPQRQNAADLLPAPKGSTNVSGDLNISLFSEEVKGKSDPTVYYGDVLRKLSRDLGRLEEEGSRTHYAVLDYMLQRFPEYRLLPPERQERTIENAIDLMLAHGDPWTVENATKRLFEVEAGESAAWMAAEEQGQKMPAPPAFAPMSSAAEADWLANPNTPTDKIRDYFEQKYANG